MIDEDVIKLLSGLPPSWRVRWCPGGFCACIGCANHAMNKAGVTREQWERCMKLVR